MAKAVMPMVLVLGKYSPMAAAVIKARVTESNRPPFKNSVVRNGRSGSVLGRNRSQLVGLKEKVLTFQGLWKAGFG